MEDRETRTILEETLKITKENNELLKKVNRRQKRGQLFTLFYWLLIIGIPLGVYYFLKPFIDQVIGLYTGGMVKFDSLLDVVNSFSDTQGVSSIFEQIEDIGKAR